MPCSAPLHQDLLTPEIMRSCIAPAAARLHSAVLRQPRRWDVVQIGKPVPNPACSILIPLYRNLGFLRFQLAALAEDPECRRSEIVLILDSPEQRAEAEHLLRGLHLATSCSLVRAKRPATRLCCGEQDWRTSRARADTPSAQSMSFPQPPGG